MDKRVNGWYGSQIVENVENLKKSHFSKGVSKFTYSYNFRF